MGLDNIPHVYPCAKAGTAIRTPEGQIDCAATKDAGQCPYLNAGPPDGAVFGILGTSCWYRGKVGEALLADLGLDSEYTFYGDDEDGLRKTPKACLQLADVMEEAIDGLSDDENVALTRYAIWYLRWVAEAGDGLDCWY